MKNVSFWDWVKTVFGKISSNQLPTRHQRSGFTKRPLEMRKADNRKRNKAARQARKRNRPLYTRTGK